MNITEETIDQLTEMGYCIHFQDQHLNVTTHDVATEMYIGFKRDGENIEHIGKTIKATKKETTAAYVMDKINSEATFKSFANHFNKMASKIGCAAYPTSYGIGVFVAIGFRNVISETKTKIESFLTETGVKFSTEYSDAGWVFRYKISKSADNIQTIERLIS